MFLPPSGKQKWMPVAVSVKRKSKDINVHEAESSDEKSAIPTGMRA